MHKNFKFANIFFIAGSLLIISLLIYLKLNKNTEEKLNDQKEIMIPYQNLKDEYAE